MDDLRWEAVAAVADFLRQSWSSVTALGHRADYSSPFSSSTIITSNLPFEEWTSVFGSQRLTGALIDRLTHHVHILELNGESYRLKQSRARRRRAAQTADEKAAATDLETGEIISAS